MKFIKKIASIVLVTTIFYSSSYAQSSINSDLAKSSPLNTTFLATLYAGTWSSIAVHELAHGLAFKLLYPKGTISEINIGTSSEEKNKGFTLAGVKIRLGSNPAIGSIWYYYNDPRYNYNSLSTSNKIKETIVSLAGPLIGALYLVGFSKVVKTYIEKNDYQKDLIIPHRIVDIMPLGQLANLLPMKFSHGDSDGKQIYDLWFGKK